MQQLSPQKKVAVVGSVVLAAMCLFPPWTEHTTGTTLRGENVNRKQSAGYAFIGSPPKANWLGGSLAMEIDLVRLVVQCMAAAGATVAAAFLAGQAKHASTVLSSGASEATEESAPRS